MARRKTELFSLSLLDLLTSALGAIIFLFIITPKGGEGAAKVRQAMVYFDTLQMKIHGELHDSLLYKEAGDTLLTVLMAYKNLPAPEKTPQKIIAFNDRKENPKQEAPPKKAIKKETPVDEPVAPNPPKAEEPKTPIPPVYKGNPPAVPCLVSFQVNWPSKEDNVDLYVCKGSSCVYGARKKDRQIGQWDSGKSRNRLFGNDLRTNQEAVRQFDQIIPGEYKIYAAFKESAENKESLVVQGMIYTKDEAKQERGESFVKRLPLSKERQLIGTIILMENGAYQFKKN